MDQQGLYVNIGINGTHYTKALIDDGCHCYMTISKSYARQLQLPRISISPRSLAQVNTTAEDAISEVTYFSLDIDGHKQQRVFCYVIPNQEDDVMIGLPWIRAEDVTLRPQKARMKIRSSGTTVKLRSKEERSLIDLQHLPARIFTAMIQRGKKRKDETKVFAASLRDIEKALSKFNQRNDVNLRDRIPPQYHEALSLFDKKLADTLPPRRIGIDHSIQLQRDEKGRELEAPWGPLYSMSKEELLVLRKTLSELLDKNFIRASNSPAAAPVLFVKKPGGGLRFCVDYRKLNEITRKDRYPLPLITETLRSLARAKWLTKLDVSAAFHKIRIREGDEWKTAFRTRYGLYEWLVTPFGLTGAPATFQRYINWTLREYLDEFVSAYIDDVLIYTDGTLDDHREKVKLVLSKLSKAGLQLDVDKCEFEQKQVKYLGYIVDVEQGIAVDPEKVEAIRNWQPPTSVRGVRGFIGFANYYRDFIPLFSNIATSLTNLTKKDVPFRWTPECQSSFETLKELLIHAPILISFDPERETRLEADSSGFAVGGCLQQKDGHGRWRPVAFYFHKSLPAEINYPIHDKELLAVVKCLAQWDSELRSVKHFKILTDHKNLEYFTKKQRLTERQMRWALELSRYDFVMVYRPGKEAVIPDSLSRRDQDLPKDITDERLQTRYQQMLQKNGDVIKLVKLGTWWTCPSPHKVRIAAGWITGGDGDQDSDEEADKLNPPENPFTDKRLRSLWDDALKENNRYWLIRKAVLNGERQLPRQWGLPISISECSIDDGKRLCWRDRIWLPHYEPLRTAVIQESHDSTLVGHPGRDLLKSILSRRFTWPGMSQDVRKFTRNCDICGRKSVWREKRRGLLKPLPIPDRPWSEISIDFITDLPLSDGNTFLMVITDRLFKNVIFQPMKTITAEAVAETLCWCLFRHHGFPIAVVSDRGPQFVGLMWKTVCKLMRIQRRLSTAFHPETDGSTERMNQVLEEYLRCFVTYSQEDWAPLLPIAMLAINNRTATSTGMSPFFVTHGYNVDPIEIDEPLRTISTSRSPIERGEAFVSRLREASDMAQALIALAQESQEEHANQQRQVAESFQAGDKVWLKMRNIKTDRPIKKLDWLNHKYTVTEIIGSHAVRLDTPPGIHDTFHVMLIKRAADDPLPSQVQDDWQPPATLEDRDGDQQKVYNIEAILKHKITKKGVTKVLIKWIGYAKPTWEPLEEFLEAEALDQYEAKNGKITTSEG
jgi:predicted aspartyl protease